MTQRLGLINGNMTRLQKLLNWFTFGLITMSVLDFFIIRQVYSKKLSMSLVAVIPVVAEFFFIALICLMQGEKISVSRGMGMILGLFSVILLTSDYWWPMK